MATPPIIRDTEKTESASHGAIFTKSDTDSVATNFAAISKGIYCGTSGDVAVVYPDDSVHVIADLAAGIIHPIRAKRINSTGTTASDLSYFY